MPSSSGVQFIHYSIQWIWFIRFKFIRPRFNRIGIKKNSIPNLNPYFWSSPYLCSIKSSFKNLIKPYSKIVTRKKWNKWKPLNRNPLKHFFTNQAASKSKFLRKFSRDLWIQRMEKNSVNNPSKSKLFKLNIPFKRVPFSKW